MPGMSESRNPPGWGLCTTVAAVVALVIYPLSFGPACWLCDRDWITDGQIDAIYFPLVDLGGKIAASRVLCWYGELLPTPQPPPNLSGFGHSNWRISEARRLLLSHDPLASR
jgi:hypothetical protein